MKTFRPETEIPKEFWIAIACFKPDDPAEFYSLLSKQTKEEAIEFFRFFLELRTELSDAMSTRFAEASLSEDTLEDLGDAFAAMGKDHYLDMYYGKRELPDDAAREDLPKIGHLMVDSFWNRFEENVFEAVDDD